VKALKIQKFVATGGILAALSTLAGCGPKAPPQLAPPPPVVMVPPQPMPPGGASPNLATPQMDAMGARHTVNYGISAAQTTWNLRSAYNVAALNCLDPKHAQIVVNYRAFLKTQARKLATVNLAVDKEFRDRNGPRFVAPREAYMTQVYNYFALPPTLPAFCDAVLAMSNEATTVKSADFDGFAARSLAALERVFLRFFLSYDQYKVDLATWQVKYTAPGVPPPSQPITQPPTLPPPAVPQ
jgi:predicted small lipoprotein YifL